MMKEKQIFTKTQWSLGARRLNELLAHSLMIKGFAFIDSDNTVPASSDLRFILPRAKVSFAGSNRAG
jgi:hypothetical protein